MRPTTKTLALLVALLLALALSACVNDDEPADEDPDAPDTWPLTGLPADDRSPAQPYPVLVLKTDNTPASAPQRGLGAADLVVEEPVEGGATRLAVFYHSRLPERPVGPVRSVRATDIPLVAPVGGVLVASGGAQQTLDRIRQSDIDLHSEGQAGFTRHAARKAPYNLFVSMRRVARAAKQQRSRPDDYLPWGAVAELPGGRPASSLTASYGSRDSRWAFRNGRYVNGNGFAAEGDTFPADSVLVLRVAMGDAGYRDPAGNPVPEVRLKGRGRALLFHNGRVIAGRWSKSRADAQIRLEHRGRELRVPAGRVWIGLVPQGSGDVSFD